MRRFFHVVIILLLSLVHISPVHAQIGDSTLRITYTLHGINDTMAWLCSVSGGEVMAIDSCRIDGVTASFWIKDPLPHGIYKIVFNDTLFTDIIYADKSIVLESTLPDIIREMKVHNSIENKLLFDYWNYNFKIQDTLDDVIERGRKLYYASQGTPSKELDSMERRVDMLEFQKHLYIQRMLGNYPEHFAPKLIWSFQKPDYRAYLLRGGQPYPSERDFYREHFFERMDFSDSRMLNTEVMYVMINDYMQNFANPPSTEVYITLTEEVLRLAKANDDVYQYCIELFLKNFEISVWEKVFIHLVEEHYLGSPKGNPHMKRVYQQRVEAVRNTSLGAKVPDVCGTTPKKVRHCLSEIQGNKALLLFWSLGCDHCESMLPGLAKVSRDYEERGFKIFAFVIAEDDKDSLQRAIDHYALPFINVSDYKEYLSPVIDQFNINLTPIMYLLDEEGIITDKPTTIAALYANLVVRYRDK